MSDQFYEVRSFIKQVKLFKYSKFKYERSIRTIRPISKSQCAYALNGHYRVEFILDTNFILSTRLFTHLFR